MMKMLVSLVLCFCVGNVISLVLPADRFMYVLGAMKSGTTNLCTHMFHHSEVAHYHPKEGEPQFHYKEPTFFGSPEYEEGIEHYWERFNVEGSEGKRFLDCSPAYLDLIDVPTQIKKAFDHPEKLRLVAVLRDPIERVISQWRHDSKNIPKGSGMWNEYKGFQDFDALILEQINRFDSCAQSGPGHNIFERCCWNVHNILRKSLYDLNVQNWLKHFPAKNLCLISNEALREDPKAILTQVSKFFGLPVESKVVDIPGSDFSHGSDTSFMKDPNTLDLLSDFFDRYGQHTRNLILHNTTLACQP